MYKKISLQELFPDWEEMEMDDISVIDLDFKRPENILGLADELDINKGVTIFLEKADGNYNNHFVLRVTDGREIISEYYLSDDLTEEIVYDLDGNMVTVESDKKNGTKDDRDM